MSQTVADRSFFIAGEVYSSKNSRRVLDSGVNIVSEACARWKKEVKTHFMIERPRFLRMLQNRPVPLIIGVHFMRKTQANYDWINMVQAIQDMMQEMGYIADDTVGMMVPVPLRFGENNFSTYDKQNPGVWLVLIDEFSEMGTILYDLDRIRPLVSPLPPKPVRRRKDKAEPVLHRKTPRQLLGFE